MGGPDKGSLHHRITLRALLHKRHSAWPGLARLGSGGDTTASRAERPVMVFIPSLLSVLGAHTLFFLELTVFTFDILIHFSTKYFNWPSISLVCAVDWYRKSRYQSTAISLQQNNIVDKVSTAKQVQDRRRNGQDQTHNLSPHQCRNSDILIPPL